jgi:hypothetical protein
VNGTGKGDMEMVREYKRGQNPCGPIKRKEGRI